MSTLSLTHLILSSCLLTFEPSVTSLNKQSPTKESVTPPYLQEVVVLDPGHGGKDPGTRSLTKPFFLEKRLTLLLSEAVRHYLKNLGYHALLTRKADHSLALEDRVEFATANVADLFVSIHFNSAPNQDAHGIEVYYFDSKKNPSRAKASKFLAETVLKRTLHYTGAFNRKVKRGDFHVIRETGMPAVLIEAGFMTNDEEMEQIKNPAYLKKLALGIAHGIDDYLAAKAAEKKKGNKVAKAKGARPRK